MSSDQKNVYIVLFMLPIRVMYVNNFHRKEMQIVINTLRAAIFKPVILKILSVIPREPVIRKFQKNSHICSTGIIPA